LSWGNFLAFLRVTVAERHSSWYCHNACEDAASAFHTAIYGTWLSLGCHSGILSVSATKLCKRSFQPCRSLHCLYYNIPEALSSAAEIHRADVGQIEVCTVDPIPPFLLSFMRGADTFTESLHTMHRLEAFIPAHHQLRPIRQMATSALAEMEDLLTRVCGADAKGGRPSIAPENCCAMLLQFLYNMRSKRQLMEHVQYNMLFRWLVMRRTVPSAGDRHFLPH
jgi:transposase